MCTTKIIQTFYTGDCVPEADVCGGLKIIDGVITDKHRKCLTEAEIAKIKRRPDQKVFFRRYP